MVQWALSAVEDGIAYWSNLFVLAVVVLCLMAICTETDSSSYYVIPRYCTIHFRLYR